MKSGKRFEDNVKKSCVDLFCYRLKDSGTSFGTNDKIRFTPSNACDFFIYNGTQLLALELKSHKGKSLPISCIRENQIKELTSFLQFGVKAGLLVFFEDLEECYYLPIEVYNSFNEERKSIAVDYFKNNGLQIEITKLKTNYRYDIKKIF
jgi:recombination protein U